MHTLRKECLPFDRADLHAIGRVIGSVRCGKQFDPAVERRAGARCERDGRGIRPVFVRPHVVHVVACRYGCLQHDAVVVAAERFHAVRPCHVLP